MGDVINLNHVRKARAAAARATTIDANRAKFGRTKAEKQAEAQERERAQALLDAAKREE